MDEELLLIPGPTMVPAAVRAAVGRRMINHRGPSFTQLYREVQAGLRRVLGTAEDVLVFPSAGTGVMESAVVNLFSPGDRVLACVMGEFGERFARIAEAFGLRVERLVVPPGRAVTAELLAERLGAEPAGGFRGVLLTHNETSTGVLLDLAAATRVAREAGALVVVDGVSSAGGVEVDCDGWGVDVLVTASQKALMTPPGLGLVAVSRRAWEAVEAARLPRYYWDYRQARRSGEKGQTPYTPAVALWFGLREALRLLEEEGLPAVYARHRRLAGAFRAGIRALGLGLLAEDAVASPLVTAVEVPPGIEAAALIRRLRERFGVVVAGGQGELAGRIFRVAHMGAAREEHVLRALAALGETLADLGWTKGPAEGRRAAEEALSA